MGSEGLELHMLPSHRAPLRQQTVSIPVQTSGHSTAATQRMITHITRQRKSTIHNPRTMSLLGRNTGNTPCSYHVLYCRICLQLTAKPVVQKIRGDIEKYPRTLIDGPKSGSFPGDSCLFPASCTGEVDSTRATSTFLCKKQRCTANCL